MIRIIFFLLLFTVNNGASSSQSKSGGKSGAANQQETTIVKVPTGPLCNYNPANSNPENKVFDPKCASGVSRAMVLGHLCYENTYTFYSIVH